MFKKNFNFNIIFFCLVLLLTPIMASEIQQTYQLENGLNIVLLQDNTAEIVTVKTIVNVGSIYEEEFLGTGISHYLEHLVAGGSTKKASEDDYKLELSLMGGVSNAYTTTDHTAYFINTTPEKTEKAIQTLHEWLFFCIFKESEVNREKEVITREIEKTYSNIQRKFYYLSQENTYKKHPSQFPVIGYLDKFKTVTKADLETFYKRNYVASNMTLILGGPIDIEKTKEIINNTFGTEKKLPKPTFHTIIEPAPFNPRNVKKEIDMNSTLISLRFPTVDLYSEHLYALDLLDYILGNGSQSILTQHLVEKLNIAYSVSTSSYTPAYTKGYFEIVIETDEKNSDKVIKETITILNQSKEKEFNRNRINRSKKQKLAENILSVTSIEDKSTRLAMSFLYSNTLDFFDTYANNFKKITSKDVIKAANLFFNMDQLITTIGIPINTKKQQKKSQSTALSNTVKKIELDNGLRIIMHPNNQAKSTKIQILTKAGILSETTETNGIGSLTAKLLGTATSKYNKEKIETIIENHGAYMEGSTGYHTLYYTLDCLSEDVKTLAPLFFHTYFDAKFKDKYIKEEKRKQENLIKRRQDDWFRYGSYTFKKQFFKSHPYALAFSGELDSIKSLNKNSFENFHEKLLNPKHMIISVMGNYDEKEIIDIIKSQSFNTKTINQSDLIIQRNANINPTHLEHKFNTTSLFMGFKGASLRDVNEKIKLDLLDTLLSGASYPGGRLHNKLRDKGFVYLVHGVNFTGIYTGFYYIYALTNEDSYKDVNTLILNEIKSLQEAPATDEEWQEAIARLKFYYKDRASSSDSLILIKAADELLLNNLNHGETIDKLIDSISKEMIMETAKKYLINPETVIFHPVKEN